MVFHMTDLKLGCTWLCFLGKYILHIVFHETRKTDGRELRIHDQRSNLCLEVEEEDLGSLEY